MAGALPRRRLGQFKPPSIPRIDRRHPLAQGLLFYAFDTGAGPLLDLAGGRPLGGIVGTAPAAAPSAFGAGLLWGGAGSAWFASDAIIRAATAAGAFSFACGYTQTGTVAQYARPFGRTANNGASTPYLNWDFQINSAGAGQTWIEAKYEAASAPVTIAFSGSGNTSETFNTAVGTIAGTSSRFFLNGGQVGALSGSAPNDYDTGDAIVIAGASASAALVPFIGFVFYGAFWSRALGAGEVAALHADPYAMLEWPWDRLPTTITGPNVSLRRMLPVESGYTQPGPPVPLEWGGANFVTDRSFWVESLSGTSGTELRPDAFTPIEFVGTIPLDRLSPVEWLWSLVADRAVPIEAIAGTSGQLLPIEILPMVLGRGGWAEWLGGIFGPWQNGPGDFSGDFSGDFDTAGGSGPPIETLQQAETSDRWSPAEILTGARGDPAAQSESLGTVPVGRLAEVEALITALSDRPAMAEALAGAALNATALIETLGLPTFSVLILLSAESAVSLVDDSSTPIEGGVVARLDAPAAAEFALIARYTRGAEAETLLSQAVTSDRQVPVEILHLAAVDGALAEWLGMVARDGADIEATALFQADRPVPAEAAGGIVRDVQSPIELLLAAVRDGAPIEAVAIARIDRSAPAESGIAAVIDAHVPAEATTTARVDPSAVIELLLGARNDQGEIEWAVVFRADPQALAEWLARPCSDATVPTEWPQRQISDPVSNTYAQLEWLALPAVPLKAVGRGKLVKSPTRTLVRTARDGVHSSKGFSAIAAGETLNMAFDFTADVGAASIAATSWACALYPQWAATNPDPQPQAHVLSAVAQAEIGMLADALYLPIETDVFVSRQGAFSVARIGGFAASAVGATYLMTATVVTSDGRTLSASADLPVR